MKLSSKIISACIFIFPFILNADARSGAGSGFYYDQIGETITYIPGVNFTFGTARVIDLVTYADAQRYEWIDAEKNKHFAKNLDQSFFEQYNFHDYLSNKDLSTCHRLPIAAAVKFPEGTTYYLVNGELMRGLFYLCKESGGVGNIKSYTYLTTKQAMELLEYFGSKKVDQSK
jgi:hypothetical protein